MLAHLPRVKAGRALTGRRLPATMTAMVDGLRVLLANPARRFIARYVVLLTVMFGVLALRPVNDRVVNPYTTFVAHEAKIALRLFGEDASVRGQTLASPRFSVAIFNGCNGLEAILIFVCGVIAFPASWRHRAIGVLLGFVAIQLFNVVRIVALFYTGILMPGWFNASHVFVWQSLAILFAVFLWLLWVQRDAQSRARA